MLPKVWIGLRFDRDWKVNYVENGSPAHQAGLREGDTLLTVNGAYLPNNQWAFDLLGFKAPGEVATFEVLTASGKKEQRVITLAPPKHGQ